jgi:hypothetical protein
VGLRPVKDPAEQQHAAAADFRFRCDPPPSVLLTPPQPRTGVSVSNIAIVRTLSPAPSATRNTGLLSKKKSVRSFMPAATGWRVSTRAVSTDPGTKNFERGTTALFSTR